jgi:selT/selW/selH-like putative selenoprotein
LIEGSGGVFDVHVNGTKVWSKLQAGRFPEHKEVLNKARTLVGKS